ncbi:D-tyrosyl-tRNA(Tyr) deacylase [Methylophaga frappieri]|uniref:D-aminoacyl-tRNA deacylase n=1 Tax=Methylophaga frappieri (strain ATCC BAA-2434 / DSM 25690 / JAM7) TaxID=754477 RepID=I1YFC9_METFJ|nr:D-aminoacyl-tRNA deacylase [Methylophaga frappieri]AFJ01622.1 D-tyrosyl-tRNA(Tyr) deacylase [Methylophaga frappieri]
MIALIQRVSEAGVHIHSDSVGQISQGILLLLGVEREDNQKHAEKLLHKVLNYRIFADTQGKMNLSLSDIQGGLLIVPQFTLPADTRKGARPSFTSAAPPNQAESLFEYFCQHAKQAHQPIATGKFGADMQVSLINDGPVTFWLQV